MKTDIPYSIMKTLWCEGVKKKRLFPHFFGRMCCETWPPYKSPHPLLGVNYGSFFIKQLHELTFKMGMSSFIEPIKTDYINLSLSLIKWHVEYLYCLIIQIEWGNVNGSPSHPSRLCVRLGFCCKGIKQTLGLIYHSCI